MKKLMAILLTVLMPVPVFSQDVPNHLMDAICYIKDNSPSVLGRLCSFRL